MIVALIPKRSPGDCVAFDEKNMGRMKHQCSFTVRPRSVIKYDFLIGVFLFLARCLWIYSSVPDALLLLVDHCDEISMAFASLIESEDRILVAKDSSKLGSQKAHN